VPRFAIEPLIARANCLFTMMPIVRRVSLMPPLLPRARQVDPCRFLSVLARGQGSPHAALLRVQVSRSPSSRLSAYRTCSTIILNGVRDCAVDMVWPRRSDSLQRRHFSDRRKDRDFQLDALPFSISPEEALQSFQNWAVNDQGLNHLLRWKSVRIGASYVPVWSFDVNIRFVTTTPEGKKKYDWKPDIFAEAYKNQPVMYVSGLSTYAGYEYRRSLINPIVNTTLVFMGDKTMPFEKYMLRDMKLSNGERIEVFPDPWHATQGRAFGVLREELEAIAKEAPGGATVQTEKMGARRVYMPTYVIEYSVLGCEYKAFVSGCDAGAGVSSVSHTVLNQDAQNASNSFLSGVSHFGMRILGNRHLASRLIILLQLFGNVFARLLSRLPLFGLVGGAFVGFRKIVQPWMDNKFASAAWEREREHESLESKYPEQADDFVDSGSAKRYFQNNKDAILRALSGEADHEEGEYDWYKEWEEWARRQYAQQQQQQQQRYGGYGQQYGQQQQEYQRQQQQQKKAPPKYKWDFNPNDPYSVLGIKRGATKKEVSAAFRKEMLKHHPDTQAGASDAAKERATERSKLITDAYRKIKAEMK